MRVSDDISNSARVSDDMGNPTRVSDDISGPIRLWHMSPIKLRHVSLTHPQTPINRSLPKAFKGRSWRHQDILGEETKTPGRDLEFRSPKALLELGLEASKNFKNFNFDYEEHSKRNHPNHIPRSQSSLESSSKASRNLTNHKSVKLYRFKPLKPRRTSTTNLRRWRTYEEREEQRISRQAHSQRFIVILFQRSSIHSSAKLMDILCSYQSHITTIPINKSFKEIKSKDNSFVIIENCTIHLSIQIRTCETILLVWLISNQEI